MYFLSPYLQKPSEPPSLTLIQRGLDLPCPVVGVLSPEGAQGSDTGAGALDVRVVHNDVPKGL